MTKRELFNPNTGQKVDAGELCEAMEDLVQAISLILDDREDLHRSLYILQDFMSRCVPEEDTLAIRQAILCAPDQELSILISLASLGYNVVQLRRVGVGDV